MIRTFNAWREIVREVPNPLQDFIAGVATCALVVGAAWVASVMFT